MKVELLTEWNYLLDKLPAQHQDVYFREEYVKLYESKQEQAVCFCYQERDRLFLLPFLKRSFLFHDQELYDFETAYGYGGPAVSSNDRDFLSRAWKSLEEYGRVNHFVAGFLRFHPLLGNDTGMEEIGTVIRDRQTVCVNLQGSKEEMWLREIHSKNRNMIRKAEKNGLTFYVDKEFNHLPEFLNLYHETMAKLDAEDFYYFPDSYYSKLRHTIPNSFLGVVLLGNVPIAAAVFFYQGQYGHYHLAGSSKAALSLSPNNFLLWSAACELKNHGVNLFHLGGGSSNSEDDSLLLFKKRFSPNRCSFRIGKVIFQRELYEQVCADWLLKATDDKAIKLQNILLKYKY